MTEQAFPNEGFNGWGEPQQGMLLRDWFAGKALQGICASGPDADLSDDFLAREAYNLADAMMKARE